MMHIYDDAGKDVTIVSHSRALGVVMEAAKELEQAGIECEVINLRTLRPLDEEAIITSVMKTNHLVTVEFGWHQCGIGAEVCARLIESEPSSHFLSSSLCLTVPVSLSQF